MASRALGQYPEPLSKAAVQLDILEIGKVYTVREPLRGGCVKVTDQKLIGMFEDYYLFEYTHSPGHRETYMKIDIHNGSIIIEGLNIKEKVLEAIEDLKVKEAERVKVSKEMLGKAIMDGYNWIMENPGQSWFISERCQEFDGYQKKKIDQGVWDKLVFEGHENKVQQVTAPGGSRGFNLRLKVDPDPVMAQTAKPEPIMATLESTNELLRLEGLDVLGERILFGLTETYKFLTLTGKKVAVDVIFREVQQ